MNARRDRSRTSEPGTADSAVAAGAKRSLPVLGQANGPGAGISRSADRRITFAGLVVAGAYLALAAASVALPPGIRLGIWLPVHLALAGAAATAIASVLPFFSTALVVAAPVHPVIRIAGIGLVAGGALGVMTVWGHAAGQPAPAAIAGGAYLAGLALVAGATFAPIRGALGIRRPLLERAYAVALANVGIGAFLATLFIAGDTSVGAAWGAVKPAHAWLNLVGFAILVIVTTLLHLAPTIVGTRLRPRASGRLAVIGVAAGAPLVALGYAIGADLVARAGALTVLAGAFGVVAHALSIHRDPARGRWTTDAGWHRMASWSLLAGQGWLGVGLAVAAGRTLAFGADPAGWSLAAIAGPLVIGGVVQILLGAISHLLPAIGPGDPISHARQRRLLGHAAIPRVVALNAGTTLVALGSGPAAGSAGDVDMLVRGGVATATIALAASLALLAMAARIGSSYEASASSLPAGGG